MVAADILGGGAITGAAMNPARALGPQLVQNIWSDCWVWYLGPVIVLVAFLISFFPIVIDAGALTKDEICKGIEDDCTKLGLS